MNKRKIMIIGAGGIGSFLVQFLSKLKIYDLTVFDSDKVERKNVLYQNYNVSHVGDTKARSIQTQFNVKSQPYDVVIDRDLDKYDLVVCCVDNMSTRRMLYNSSKPKQWLDLRAQGRNAVLISSDIDKNKLDMLLVGDDGSYSCQAQEWDGSAEQVNQMNIVIAAMGSQWIQKRFNGEQVSDFVTVSI
jgi:molybdopterin/thiamine biosynthesis adenylyltransferase